MKCSLCADSTGENPSMLIRGAAEAIDITTTQCIVEQSTVVVGTAVFDELRVQVNTVE
jgi:hypothetical protein